VPSNVARMCGSAQNAACPATLSSVYPDLPASNSNDGSTATASFVSAEIIGAFSRHFNNSPYFQDRLSTDANALNAFNM